MTAISLSSSMRRGLAPRGGGVSFALDLNFATMTVLDSRVTFTRASSATRFNSAGVLVTETTNTPRFDYNPSTLVARGLLIEEPRTNLFLNSTIDGANLATQTVTVAAVPYTISFYGTGTITLTGVAVATITGTGAFPTRTTYTFTPTAGSLICTVTGTVQYANIEAGAFATSYIPTSAATVTRAADDADMLDVSWHTPAQGTFVIEEQPLGADSSNAWRWGLSSVGSGIYLAIKTATGAPATTDYFANSVPQNLSPTGLTTTANNKLALAYSGGTGSTSANGSAVVTGAMSSPAGTTQMGIGRLATIYRSSGWTKRITFYNTRKTDAELPGLST